MLFNHINTILSGKLITELNFTFSKKISDNPLRTTSIKDFFTRNDSENPNFIEYDLDFIMEFFAYYIIHELNTNDVSLLESLLDFLLNNSKSIKLDLLSVSIIKLHFRLVELDKGTNPSQNNLIFSKLMLATGILKSVNVTFASYLYLNILLAKFKIESKSTMELFYLSFISFIYQIESGNLPVKYNGICASSYIIDLYNTTTKNIREIEKERLNLLLHYFFSTTQINSKNQKESSTKQFLYRIGDIPSSLESKLKTDITENIQLYYNLALCSIKYNFGTPTFTTSLIDTINPIILKHINDVKINHDDSDAFFIYFLKNGDLKSAYIHLTSNKNKRNFHLESIYSHLKTAKFSKYHFNITSELFTHFESPERKSSGTNYSDLVPKLILERLVQAFSKNAKNSKFFKNGNIPDPFWHTFIKKCFSYLNGEQIDFTEELSREGLSDIPKLALERASPKDAISSYKTVQKKF